jgi:lipoprotein-anchoring transpeptidase ErfK/SrfK
VGSHASRRRVAPEHWTRACGALALLALTAGAANAHLRIDIDKTAQRMTVSVDGVARHSWPISSGRAGQPTPSGRFRPLTMVRKEYSRTYDAPMPYAIYFTNDGHAIHGTNADLGAPASRGCVRIGLKHAALLFALTKRHGRKKTVIRVKGRDAEPAWAEGGAH